MTHLKIYDTVSAFVYRNWVKPRKYPDGHGVGRVSNQAPPEYISEPLTAKTTCLWPGPLSESAAPPTPTGL